MSWMETSLYCKLQVVVRVSLHKQAYLQNSLMIGHWGTQGAALHQESVSKIVLREHSQSMEQDNLIGGGKGSHQ